MKRVCLSRESAFTLIELLIVVAIIAILAAIAVPNFLEAQTRSKIATVYSDFRTLKTGMEAYRVDNSGYPIDWNDWYPGGGLDDFLTWRQLTTPIAYITSVFYTPFLARNLHHNPYGDREVYIYGGGKTMITRTPADQLAVGIEYVVQCAGPDEDADYLWNDTEMVWVDQEDGRAIHLVYDATNGTRSSGDILMTNKRMYGTR